MGYLKSENESLRPNIPEKSPSPFFSYSVPSIISHIQNPVTSDKSALNAISQDSFSFINTKDTPWIILPSSVRLRISVKQSAENLGYLDIFSSSPHCLLNDISCIQRLKINMPDFLTTWLLHVRLFYIENRTLNLKEISVRSISNSILTQILKLIRYLLGKIICDLNLQEIID